MRTFGSLKLMENKRYKSTGPQWEWEITAEPHVMIKLKQVMPRINKGEVGTVRISHTPETCFDLEWFIKRYPLKVLNSGELIAGAEEYRLLQESLEIIRHPKYKPQKYPMALPPRDYQALAAETYLKRGGLLLADQLGLGKSITAIATFTDLRTLPALVVVQAHLQKQWQAYIAKFLPSAKTHIIKQNKNYKLPPCDVYIITYSKLASWAETLKGFIKSVIYDEGQELRRAESQKYTSAKAISALAKYSMALSATPIFNYGGEIFNILDVIFPGQLGDKDEFHREWCHSMGDHWLLSRPDAFHSYLVENFLMMRRTRLEVAQELPPVSTVIETVEHTAQVLQDLEGDALELARRIISSETEFHEKGEAARQFDIKLRQATGVAKAPFVAAFVKSLLDDGEKVLLSGWHKLVYDVWHEHLDKYGISWYTGDETPAVKDRAVEAFISGTNKLFITSLRSGSGLDGLQNVCSVVVHGELDWSPGVHEQVRGRVFRDGQAHPVTEYFLISDAGSDPVVADILGIKKAQLKGLIDPGGSCIADLQTEGGRVKRLAHAYLASRRSKNT